ncbi:heavy metal sensor histidine kinase [Geomesophilobacter sediminis]|uniref:histidine kinase n=1 Tax=Geomesophilobacter sediminis TaxID=2798584 RepID=A0A8J7M224_9BACT|nr:heavy metal sensor histidine kinase [Geomesophilobacter sediminis]MBJ6727275.1 heavy metal sensor histidine kinase [Geomesophilobacter sediminis]
MNNAEPVDSGVPSRSRSRSLTVWFLVANSTAVFLLFASFTSLLYFGLAKHLNDESRLLLQSEVNAVEHILRFYPLGQMLENEVNPSQTSEEYVKHYIRVLDPAGRELAETRGMDAFAPAAQFRLPPKGQRSGTVRQWENAAGDPVLGTAVWLNLGKDGVGAVEVALDLGNMNNILTRFRLLAFGAGALGLPVCLLVSLAIVRRGTRSLREMTESVRGISVANLGARLSWSDWPEEVASLARVMNSMLDRLQDSFERLYNSAVNLSHKMRTPLTIMRGEAEVALAHERSTEELRDVILSGLEENDRLTRLIENILFLANAEIGKLPLERREMEAADQVEMVVDYYEPLAEEKGIALSWEGAARVVVDPALFRKAVAALVANGITYNHSGGSVAVKLRQTGDLACEIRVMDSGAGIPVEEREKVFDRFYRIYATRFLDPHGTGLGLPIVRTIMNLHGGTVALDGAGPGTTVILNFPAAAVAPELFRGSTEPMSAPHLSAEEHPHEVREDVDSYC